MNRFLPTVLVTLVMVAGQSSLLAAPSVDAILEAWVKASGGKEALQKLQTRTAKGTLEITAAGMTAQLEYQGKAPNQRATKVNVPGYGEARELCDGTSAWSINPAGTTQKSGAQLARARREAVFQRELRFKEQFERLEVKGSTQINGRDTWILVATPKGEPAERYFFDAQSGLLVRSEAQIDGPNGPTNASVDLDDYRVVDGVKLPHRVRLTQPAEMAFTMQLTEVRHNQPVPDSTFSPPKD